MSRIFEAKNVYGAKKEELALIKSSDALVEVWHGTNEFWALWFCVYGVDGTVTPPTKTLGRGSMSAGFSKITDPGLYVMGIPLAGFKCHVALDVRPSELEVSHEMKELGYSDALGALAQRGECVVTVKLSPRRTVAIVVDGKRYGRKEFLARFDDPLNYLEEHLDGNMYHSGDNKLLKDAQLNRIFREFKNSGESYAEIVEALQDMIRHKDYLTLDLEEEDFLTVLEWARAKAEKE